MYRCPTLSKAISFCLDMETLLVEEVTIGLIGLYLSIQLSCTGKTQRDWVEREVGEGIGMGNTCKSMADSCQCMAKTTKIL